MHWPTPACGRAAKANSSEKSRFAATFVQRTVRMTAMQCRLMASGRKKEVRYAGSLAEEE
jgi:hypothetical protein